MLGIFDKDENPAFPGVKTLEAQGYKVYVPVDYGIAAPAGVPGEIVNVLDAAIERTTATEDFEKKMDELGRNVKYMDARQYTAYWEETEARMKPLLEDLNKK